MNQNHKLGISQWDALEKAEKPLYEKHEGVHAFTDVNVNEGHELLHFMWEHAEIQVQAQYPEWPFSAITEEEIEAEVAKRVANALAVLAFGIEGDLVENL